MTLTGRKVSPSFSAKDADEYGTEIGLNFESIGIIVEELDASHYVCAFNMHPSTKYFNPNSNEVPSLILTTIHVDNLEIFDETISISWPFNPTCFKKAEPKPTTKEFNETRAIKL